MMFASSDPKQPYYVANQIKLHSEDDTILIKLYQPLVGATAIALYQTLIHEYDPYSIISDSKGLYHLQEELDCSLKRLFAALHKLEAVGLVQTFLADSVFKKVLIFKLLKVPPASKFFATPLLASLLREKVGVTAFHDLSYHFAQINKLKAKPIKNAKDVSATFLDVFRLPENEAITPSKDVQAAAQANQTHEIGLAKVNDQDPVDWNFMKELYQLQKIPASEVEKNKNQIRGLMQTYGLTEKDFVDESLPALHGTISLNMHEISNLLAENYRRLQTRENVQQKVERQAKLGGSNSNFNDEEKELLKSANEYSPAEFLYRLKMKKGGIDSPGEKQIINNLHTQYGLPENLVNLLTYTCLTYDTVVSSRLAYKIANDWLQHGVATAAQALEYIKKRRQHLGGRKNYVRHYQPKRIEKGTDWSKKKAKTDNNASDVEIKQFLKDFEKKNGMK